MNTTPAPTPEAPEAIEPHLNPAYWDQRFMGDGAAEPWPDLGGEVGLRDYTLGVSVLSLFGRQGARRLASSRLLPGDTFRASDYERGAVLLTLAERLSRVPGSDETPPMQQFQNVPIPDHLSGIVDGDQKLEGHGYKYEAHPLLNLIVGTPRRVLVVPDSVVGAQPDFNDKDYVARVADGLTRGFEEFTVGKVYNFGDNERPENQVLARVTEAIVCMGGIGGLRLPSLKALLAKRRGGAHLPATNPATG